MKTRCACKGFFLDKFIRPSILLELYDQDLKGPDILKQLNSGPMVKYGKFDPTGFYRMLKVMEEEGIIVSRWEIHESKKPIKVFSITTEGKYCLQMWELTFKQYIKDISELSAQITEKISRDKK